MELPVNYDKLNAKTRKAVREQYVEMQDNKCWFCETELDKDPHPDVLEKPIHLELFPKGFLSHPVHLQHDHTTGLTEGAVHSYCNAVLWEYLGR